MTQTVNQLVKNKGMGEAGMEGQFPSTRLMT